tara:strand:+ start:185 stop:586 length:402 start_codon:yes stop_codon:yes gene_type:complete
MNIATKAVIKSGSTYLLQLRDNKKEIFSPNHWGLFGGKKNNYETSQKAIKREIFEELGVNCKVLKKIGEGFHKPSGTKNIFYLIKSLNAIKSKNLKEGQDLGWFTLSQMKKMKLTWETKFIIKKIELNKRKKN